LGPRTAKAQWAKTVVGMFEKLGGVARIEWAKAKMPNVLGHFLYLLELHANNIAFNTHFDGDGATIFEQPMVDPAGAIWRAEPLRHDALAAESADVFEDGRPKGPTVWRSGQGTTLWWQVQVAALIGLCPGWAKTG
jgi:hypothetical protein